MELEERIKKDDEYVKNHCVKTMKHQTRVVGSVEESHGSERVWICDGRIVEDVQSNERAAIGLKIGMNRKFLKEHCKDIDENPGPAP